MSRSEDETTTVVSGDPGLRRMSADECWDFLARHQLGRVAIVQMGHPMIFPVNYALDERSVVFRSSRGAKLTAGGIGQQAAFEVDEASPRFETGASVVVHGTILEVIDRSERTRLERLDIRPWASGARDHFLRVEMRWISGRALVDPDAIPEYAPTADLARPARADRHSP